MAVIKTIGKLAPGAYKQMIDHLTRRKIKNPFIKAKDIVVNKKPEVEEREMFNRFNQANPRQDMAGGGMLVQPSVDGSRPGYADQPVRTNIFKNLDKDFQKYYKENLQKKFGPFDKLKAPQKSRFKTVDYPRYLKFQKEKQKLQKAAKTKSTESLQSLNKKLNIKNSNEFVKKWINKNIKKYNVREFDNFKKDLFNDFNTEITNNPKKYPMRKNTQMFKNNFPVVGDIRGTELISIDNIKFPRIDKDRTQEFAYKKLFYQNKLKEPKFKKQVEQYIDWSLTKKTAGGAGSLSKTAALDQAKIAKSFNDDVIFFMGEILNERALTPGGGQIGIHDIFKKIFPEKGKKYFNKYHNTWANWKNNFDTVAKLAGLDQNQTKALLQKQINDSKKLKRLYNVQNLPLEFVFVQDHLYGLAEAKALGDPRIARQTLKNLVAATNEQNRILGKEGFSKKRVALMNKFKKASLENKIGIVNELNTLSEEYVPGRIKYNVRKDGSLKITNLQPEPTFKSKAAAYRELAKNFPVNIKKRFSILGGGKCETRGLLNQGGRVGLRDGTPSVDVCFTNALERIRKGGVDFTNAEAINFNKLTKGLRAAGASNIIKFGVLPEILLEGALIADKMASEGDSFAQGLRNSYLAIPFQALGVAKTYEEGEKDRILAATPESQRGKVLDVFNLQDTLNKKFELMGASEGFKRQIAATDAVSDGPLGYVGDSQDLQKRLSDTRADLQDLSRGDINRAERILTSSPLDLNIQDQLTMDAFKAATEKADADKASRILVAPGTGLEDVQIKKRMKDIPITPEYAKEQLQATGDYYGKGYTPFGLNKLFTLFGMQNPRFGYDEQGVYDEDRGLQDYTNYLRTAQFAENFRDEKAGGGIAKLAGDRSGPPPERGPNSQGLPGLLKRVRNL
jgi:hypothetical protein